MKTRIILTILIFLPFLSASSQTQEEVLAEFD